MEEDVKKPKKEKKVRVPSHVKSAAETLSLELSDEVTVEKLESGGWVLKVTGPCPFKQWRGLDIK